MISCSVRSCERPSLKQLANCSTSPTALWGDGTTPSSDGQFFRSGRRARGAGAVNAKYGPEPGLRVYAHLSDLYGSFHAKVISATASEAPHVLDGW